VVLNIGVMELHADVENLYTEASLATYCGAHVTIFTTGQLYEKVLPFFGESKDGCTWVIRREGESFGGFLKRIETYCTDEIDVLFLNTFLALPHHQILYHVFKPDCKIVHVVGRIERFFGKWHPIRYSSLKQFTLSVLANVSQYIANRTFEKFDAIWVENKDAYNYAVSAGYRKNIFCLPFQYARKQVQGHGYNGKLRLVTIGTLCHYRRDYNGLLDVFEKLFDAGRKNITLTFLGAPVDGNGFRTIGRCKELIEKGMDINYYTEYIPEEVVNQEISSADIIISPSEVGAYGTGTFGSIVKAMQFAKPGIYPVNSLHHEELASSSLLYEKIEDLPGIIENLLDNPGRLKRLSQNAGLNSRKFSFETVADKFQEAIIGLIEP